MEEFEACAKELALQFTEQNKENTSELGIYLFKKFVYFIIL